MTFLAVKKDRSVGNRLGRFAGESADRRYWSPSSVRPSRRIDGEDMEASRAARMS
jgi:hypothetical protein